MGLPGVTDKLLEPAFAANPFGERHETYVCETSKAGIELVNWTAEGGFAWQLATVTGEPGPVGLVPAGSEGAA